MNKKQKKDFSFDFGFCFGENALDINAICAEVVKKGRVCFDLKKGTRQLEYLLQKFEKEKEYRFLSNGKGFASINFIDYVCKKHGAIKQLYVSTLGVGKKHIQHLDTLPIEAAHFVVGNIFQASKAGELYRYFSIFRDVCKKRGWTFSVCKNHSKIILMRTVSEFFVLETSSNLNENPKMEQFCFMSDKHIYLFYQKFFEELKAVTMDSAEEGEHQ